MESKNAEQILTELKAFIDQNYDTKKNGFILIVANLTEEGLVFQCEKNVLDGILVNFCMAELSDRGLVREVKYEGIEEPELTEKKPETIQ